MGITIVVVVEPEAASPSVIIVGVGISGISAAKTLSDAGIEDILILEATDRIGVRIHKTNLNFAGVNVEMGADWVQGVNGQQMNPIWEIAKKLSLRTFYSDFDNITSNTYKQDGGLSESAVVQEAIDHADKVDYLTEKFTAGCSDDMSLLTFQCLKSKVPTTPVEMAVDCYACDYEFAEPPQLTSVCSKIRE